MYVFPLIIIIKKYQDLFHKIDITNFIHYISGDVLQSTVANPHSARAQYVQEQTQTTNTKSRIRTPLRPPLQATNLEADELMDKIVGRSNTRGSNTITSF